MYTVYTYVNIIKIAYQEKFEYNVARQLQESLDSVDIIYCMDNLEQDGYSSYIL